MDTSPKLSSPSEPNFSCPAESREKPVLSVNPSSTESACKWKKRNRYCLVFAAHSITCKGACLPAARRSAAPSPPHRPAHKKCTVSKCRHKPSQAKANPYLHGGQHAVALVLHHGRQHAVALVLHHGGQHAVALVVHHGGHHAVARLQEKHVTWLTQQLKSIKQLLYLKLKLTTVCAHWL